MAKVYSYSTNPLHVLSVSELGDGRFFGIELEYSFVAGLDTMPDPQRAIWKEDSSIGYEGAELVSAPMLLEQIPAWLESLDTREWVADQRCGMHVHINRAALTERQIAILMACVEDDYLYSFVREEAGRDFACSKYCKKSKDNQSGGRYQAVNLTRSSTVEVRIFAGTSCKDTILQRVQWLNDLVEYASLPGAAPSYAAFMAWRGEITEDEYSKLKQAIKRLQEEEIKRKEKEDKKKARQKRWDEVGDMWLNAAPWVAGGLGILIGLGTVALYQYSVHHPHGGVQQETTIEQFDISDTIYY